MDRINKSQIIREALRKNRDLKPAALALKLQEDGYEGITASFISNIKTSDKRKRSVRQAGNSAAEPVAVEANRPTMAFSDAQVQLLTTVRNLTVNYSLAEIKSALEVLESLAE